MSAQTPPLPLSILEQKDKRTKRLNFLVTRLVSALVDSDPERIVAIIGTFVRYFTRLLEALKKITEKENDLRDPENPSI